MSTLAARRPEWAGRTVVCIASGPSLTSEDCERVRASGHPTIVTNSSHRLAPWAEVLFGFDSRWWKENRGEAATFQGRRVSVSQIAPNLGVETTYGCTWFQPFGNSGASAVAFALAGNAARILLLGFDCGFSPAGRKHWHEDHPGGMSNCLSIKRWPGQFAQVARRARQAGVPVFNVSRETTLTCFDRASLESVL